MKGQDGVEQGLIFLGKGNGACISVSEGAGEEAFVVADFFFDIVRPGIPSRIQFMTDDCDVHFVGNVVAMRSFFNGKKRKWVLR